MEAKDIEPVEALNAFLNQHKEFVDETKDYLQNEGEIDYSKVPNIDLSLPLPNSKSARNPELFKTLNRVVLLKKIYNGDTRYSTNKSNDYNSFQGQDENLRRLAQKNLRNMQRVDKDLRYNISNRPELVMAISIQIDILGQILCHCLGQIKVHLSTIIFKKISNFEVSNTGPVNFDRPVLFKCSRSKC
ncbi:hypothetical protein HZH68_002903 [Vespula germanica]|uniref:Uncharacterized protein n=1 Tax=Vespula germanica TaxID=30212 RepID=A0A834NNA1_VESGE|nr:hypothetical protein HZH68_002903 [Vespula germanica]